MRLFLRRIGNVQYLTLMPSIKVLDKAGAEIRSKVANPIKMAILGYQHNEAFNQAVMQWREKLLPEKPETTYEFPPTAGRPFASKSNARPSSVKSVCRLRGRPTQIPDKMRHLVKYDGIELSWTSTPLQGRDRIWLPPERAPPQMPVAAPLPADYQRLLQRSARGHHLLRP